MPFNKTLTAIVAATCIAICSGCAKKPVPEWSSYVYHSCKTIEGKQFVSDAFSNNGYRFTVIAKDKVDIYYFTNWNDKIFRYVCCSKPEGYNTWKVTKNIKPGSEMPEDIRDDFNEAKFIVSSQSCSQMAK